MKYKSATRRARKGRGGLKKFRNLVIGGIENKVFNLILLTTILIAGVFILVINYQNKQLSTLVAETSVRQRESITEITGSLMETVVENSLDQTTGLEASIANEIFRGLKTRVEMLGQYAQKLVDDPQAVPQAPCAAPDPAQNGEIVPQLILAEGVDIEDPDLAVRVGAIANLSDMMVAMFGASEETNSCFIALPDGVFLVTDDRTASKFDENGVPVPYDPRTRPWYIQAVEAGGLIFTDVEIDAFTGDIGIVCAMPVYVDGELAAVVGSDLFLNAMKAAVESSEIEGGFVCVINQNGHVVFSPKTEGVFEVRRASEAADLRMSDNEALAALVSDGMQARTDVRRVTLSDGSYYMIGVPMDTLGWALVAVFSEDVAAQPAAMLEQNYARIEAEATQAYRESVGHSRATINVLLVTAILLLLTGSVVLGKRIVRPLNTITKRISELSETNLEFKMEDAFRTGDEIEVLAESFAAISHRTVEYLGQVRRVTAEKERVNTELKLSHDIQVNMLPNIFPAFPERREFDIYASMVPAKEVGGDFYDFYLVDDSHLVMVIADVSGKGIPAAMFMMASKIIINNISTMGVSDPGQILEAANRQITSNNPAEMFVTVWLGVLDLDTGLLNAANGGHEYPCVMRRGGKFELMRDRHGFVLGGMPGCRYRTYSVQLDPGDAIFVYTDGVTEATDASEALFGTDRLVDALNRAPEASCKTLLGNVKNAVDAFVQDAPQFDDTTMLAVRYNGKA